MCNEGSDRGQPNNPNPGDKKQARRESAHGLCTTHRSSWFPRRGQRMHSAGPNGLCLAERRLDRRLRAVPSGWPADMPHSGGHTPPDEHSVGMQMLVLAGGVIEPELAVAVAAYG